MSGLKYRFLPLFFIALVLVGCGSKNTSIQAFKYHENAKKRPIVAMLPVLNRTDSYLPWDLSQEFTSEIQKRLMHRSVVYLNSVDVPTHLRMKLERADVVNLARDDFHELAAQNDFVVLLELLEHSETPLTNAYIDAETPAESMDRVLNMKMRVKVIDLRASTLKVVLQQVKNIEHLIPRDYSHVNYEKVVWGSDAYPATAYGRAHAKLEKELSKQIENYISIAH